MAVLSFYAMALELHEKRRDPNPKHPWDYLMWAGAGVVSLGLMTLFFKL
ncbi:hypothetical protein [Streptomyces sp. NPDC086766]